MFVLTFVHYVLKMLIFQVALSSAVYLARPSVLLLFFLSYEMYGTPFRRGKSVETFLRRQAVPVFPFALFIITSCSPLRFIGWSLGPVYYETMI